MSSVLGLIAKASVGSESSGRAGARVGKRVEGWGGEAGGAVTGAGSREVLRVGTHAKRLADPRDQPLALVDNLL